MVRDYLKERVFERPVELEDKVILRRLAENDAEALVVGACGEAIRSLSITESAFRVSDTPPFPWSRQTVEGERTVFNPTPVDNALGARFARFLDRASDVAA
jgi:type III restriction enzyme